MSFSIRLTDTERQLAMAYAQMHSLTMSEAFKKALFDKIEDEYDLKVANEAHQEYVDSGYKSRPIDDLWKELDL